MLRACPSIALTLWVVALLCGANVARAGTLYKCDTKDGSIAYTGSRKGFTHCKALATYADAAKPAATEPAPKVVADTPHVAQPERASPAKAPARNGWVYQENVASKADFADVAAGGASAAPRPLFARVEGGVSSTAPILIEAPTVAPIEPTHAPPREKSTIAAAAKILRGAVYKIERKDGITEYTNIRPSGHAFAVLFTYIATCVACDLHSKIDFARTALNLDAYKTEIAAAAADYGIDSSLLRAVIHAESAFNPLAVSAKGAQGLMQLMPGTAGDLGVTDAFDAAQNIRGGARYLAQLLKDFNGDAQLATAAYNAGEGAVQKYRGVPPYDETQVYVQRVATLRDRYQKAM